MTVKAMNFVALHQAAVDIVRFMIHARLCGSKSLTIYQFINRI